MDVTEAISKRRSVRAWQNKPVEPEKLQRVLEAARLAPSANNRQPWRFVVVTDPAIRKQLIKAANDQTFVGKAPVVIVGCAVEIDRVMACGLHCYPIDLAIAMTNITLAAVAEGLGTCWIGAFQEPQVKAILNIPDEVRVVELMPLGYPESADVPARPRKSMKEVCVYERWS
jgi:nitroreductase